MKKSVRNKKKNSWMIWIIVFIFIIFLAVIFSFIKKSQLSPSNPVECFCNSCTNCSSKVISASCDIIKLTNDISPTSGNCISGNVYRKTIDCQNYKINISFGRIGIELSSRDNIVRNCNLVGTGTGIRINSYAGNSWNGYHNTIINNLFTGVIASDGNKEGTGILFLRKNSTASPKNNIIFGNNFTNLEDGIDATGTGTDNNISNNQFLNSYRGVYLFGSFNLIMQNNIACGNSHDIDFGGTSNSPLRNYSGNVCDKIYSTEAGNQLNACDSYCNGTARLKCDYTKYCENIGYQHCDGQSNYSECRNINGCNVLQPLNCDQGKICYTNYINGTNGTRTVAGTITCDNCKPSCTGKECGGDGCGGFCGTNGGNCSIGKTCNTNHNASSSYPWARCEILCSCVGQGFECGNQTICGTNNDCGRCNNEAKPLCNSTGKCVSNSLCSPNSNVCVGRTCGSFANGTCGNVSCGSCSSGYNCSLGNCINSSTGQNCTPNCAGKTCGQTNGCGGNCTNCNNNRVCDQTSWQCISCNPNNNVCSGKQCGSFANGTCGSVSCGSCSSGKTCSSGNCVSISDDCGNGICDSGEKTSCPEDCKSSKWWIWILIIVILILVIIGVIIALILLNKKAKNQNKLNSGNIESRVRVLGT